MRFLPLLTAIACAAPGPVAPQGNLLIEEVYYAGAVPAAGVDHYFSDQFIQLYNPTKSPIQMGGLLIGNAAGVAGEINPGTEPDSYALRRPNRVVLENVWQIPGEADDLLLEPGQSLLIAHDGTNHQPMSTVDLTGASFETYVEESGGDEDHPLVDNLIPLHFTGGYDWLISVFGATVVVMNPDSALTDLSGTYVDYKTVANEDIVDAVDALMDANSVDFKRLPATVDAGFTFVSDIYTGQSVHRVLTDGEMLDTNDSSVDFIAGPPSPYEP